MSVDLPRKRVIPQPTTFRAPGTTSRFRPHGGLYNERIGTVICERLMMKKSLKEICEDPRMPSERTVVRWLADPKRADFREMYYYARRVQAELRVDEIFEIADNSEHDWKPRYNKDGDLIDYKPDNEAIQRSRVRIDVRKWYAAKLVPRVYGEKVEHEHEVVGDLAELLKSASNQSNDLPPPIDNDADG